MMNTLLPIEIARKKRALLDLLDQVIDLTDQLDRLWLFNASESSVAENSKIKNAA